MIKKYRSKNKHKTFKLRHKITLLLLPLLFIHASFGMEKVGQKHIQDKEFPTLKKQTAKVLRNTLKKEMRASNIKKVLETIELLPIELLPITFQDPVHEVMKCSLLHLAAALNQPEAIRALFKKAEGIDINIRDEMKMTPLFYAVSLGNNEVINALLDNNAHINAQGAFDESSVLRFAIGTKQPRKVIKLLKERGAKNFSTGTIMWDKLQKDWEEFKRTH